MKHMLYIILFMSLSIWSCKKYQVIQEVRVNMYHLHNPKHGVEVILTHDTLEIGKWYKINRLNTIDIEK